jgi:DNA invertase Pin-like site-specific DNA recombinase
VTRKRVDGYVRVSRIGGRDGYISPEVQREQIEAFASLMGVEIDAWHDDQDYSGGWSVGWISADPESRT